MDFPLILYRISGWSINLTTLFIAFKAIRNKRLWQSNYRYLGLYFVVIAVAELTSSITALFLKNNLFIDYFRVPMAFALCSLYLSGLHKSKKVFWLTIGAIIFFIILQVYEAIEKKGLFQLNFIGISGSALFFLLYTFSNLTILFKQKTNLKLREIPDFWFTGTLFCFEFLGIITTILSATSYAAQSDMVLYAIFITENFIKVGLYYGYYKGISLI